MATLKVKLVIWDLDETLWEGTLSEGEVNCYNGTIVKELSEHGIINSISSKNDFDRAKEKLVDLGLWDYFVFPSINWHPKGEAVKRIIEECQLRAPNVVFVDDNLSNLKEVEYYNPGITTISSIAELQSIINLDEYKQDLQLNRLAQYKILEKKKEYKEQTCTSNKDFLIKSNIKIEFISDLEPIKERLVEMIGRTNQLNYTKLRIGLGDINALISDPNFECKALRVVDNFGDYGICGFYAYNKSSHSLLHFLFSCRILNIGVENYVYQKLGRPDLAIVEPVTTPLNSDDITWISETDGIKEENFEKRNSSKIRIALIGGCDLDQMCHYLNTNDYEIIKDFNYPNQRNNVVHREHTVFQRMSGHIGAEIQNIIYNLPIFDDKCLYFQYQHDYYDYLVFSPLMNYTQELYRHKKLGFFIAYGGYTNICNLNKLSSFSDSELLKFQEDFEFVGQQSQEEFKKDLEWLISSVESPIIFLNGSEVNKENKNEIGAVDRHKIMNKALEEVVNKHSSKCKLIDVRKFVKTEYDVTDNIRHYKREAYIEIAKEIMILTTGKSRVSSLEIFKQRLLCFARRIKKKLIR